MMLTVKHSLRCFIIVLLVIQLTGCATYQESIQATSTRKDEWFAKDKLKHFSASFLIGAATYSVARWGNASKDDASIIGFFISSTCGIAKEINDEARRDNWSYKDLIWDFIGGGAGVSLSNSLD
ncbi:MAG: hypothetical protein H8D23_26925 [Candidatus Brocadiales bacterium]|nr:hypothetical protein [Candidatus Brocadiales bacterium]